MKIIDINDELFELNGVTYSKGDYVLEVDSRNTYKKDGNPPYIFIINKYTNKSILQDSIPFLEFKKENNTNFKDLKELSYFISEAITLKQQPKKHSELLLDDGTNPHNTTKSDVGLSNVDNTSDLNKPVSTATQLVLDLKLDKFDNLIFVIDINDLPTAISNIITLEDDKTYYFLNNLDLNGNRIISGKNTTILGLSSEVSSITSTGLSVSTPLFSSIYTTPIRNISFKNVDTAFNFDGTTNPSDMALDWTGVNIINIPNIGIIKEASNFIYDKGAILNSKGLCFDGTINTIALNNSIFTGDGIIGNMIDILPTCVITRRFRVIYSSVVIFGSTVGINVDILATIPNESYILDTVNFSGGGTYLTGVIVTDNKALFINCKGINNSSEVSQYYMNNNLTSTVIGIVNTPYKISGVTSSAPITQKFNNTNNRATYVGSITRYFKVTTTLSAESGNNNQIGCYISKNGIVINESEVYGTTSGTGRAENIVIQTLVELSTNDYIEIFVENATSANNILVTNLNTIIQ